MKNLVNELRRGDGLHAPHEGRSHGWCMMGGSLRVPSSFDTVVYKRHKTCRNNYAREEEEAKCQATLLVNNSEVDRTRLQILTQQHLSFSRIELDH